MTVRLSHRVILAAILGLAVALRLWHASVIRESGIIELPRYFVAADMNANLEWATTIVGGDILGRHTYHPFHDWMRAIAPLETWEEWWGGSAIFQQAPLYPYLLAGIWSVTGISLTGAIILQLLIGALQPLALFALAARIFGRPAGLSAAALAAVYAPAMALQGTLLRDWLPWILDPLALWLLLMAHDSGRRLHLWLAGATFGISILARESSVPVLAFSLIWLAVVSKQSGRSFVRPVVTVAAAAILVITPLLVRNLVVGAPPFALSNRTAEVLITGNAADGFPVGVYFPPSTGTLLERSGGRTGPLIREILADYRGQWHRLAGNMVLKVRGVLDPMEIPDNVSFNYLRDKSPPLRIMDWGNLVPLGIAGLVLVWPVWRRRGLLLGYATVQAAVLMATLVLGRYRLPLAMPLMVLAAGGLSLIPETVRSRRFGRLAAWAAVLVVVALCQHLLAPLKEFRSDSRWALDSAEHATIAIYWADEGEYSRSIGELDALARKAAGPPAFPEVLQVATKSRVLYQLLLAEQLLGRDDRAGARQLVERAAEATDRITPPPGLSFELGSLYHRLGDFPKASQWLSLYVRKEPDGEHVVEAQKLLSAPDP